MTPIADALAYFLRRYPHKHELSRSRLMSMVYLADWKGALERREQVTDAQWSLGNYGPFSQAVYDALENDDRFRIVIEENVHGTTKGRVELAGEAEAAVAGTDQPILDFVVSTTQPLRWT